MCYNCGVIISYLGSKMQELFYIFSSLIIFLHVVSAVIWVGGMIAIRFVVHYSIIKIEEPKVRLGRNLELLKRFFDIVKYLIPIILVTALFMIFGLEFKDTPLNKFVYIKEAIWMIMTIVFVVIYIKRDKAQKKFDSEDIKAAKEELAPLSRWMIPANTLLGLIAIYLGVTLRGF